MEIKAGKKGKWYQLNCWIGIKISRFKCITVVPNKAKPGLEQWHLNPHKAIQSQQLLVELEQKRLQGTDRALEQFPCLLDFCFHFIFDDVGKQSYHFIHKILFTMPVPKWFGIDLSWKAPCTFQCSQQHLCWFLIHLLPSREGKVAQWATLLTFNPTDCIDDLLCNFCIWHFAKISLFL